RLFQEFVRGWQAFGVAEEWCRGFPSPGQLLPDGHARFRGTRGMTDIPKLLADGLDVRVSSTITAVELDDAEFVLRIEGHEALRSEALIMTAPVPQSIALLDAGGVALAAGVRSELESVDYAPCFAAMIV